MQPFTSGPVELYNIHIPKEKPLLIVNNYKVLRSRGNITIKNQETEILGDGSRNMIEEFPSWRSG